MAVKQRWLPQVLAPACSDMTPFGASLVRHARSVRVQVREALGEIESLRQGVAGRVAETRPPGREWVGRFTPACTAPWGLADVPAPRE
jgi:hypothetical protein